MGIQPDRDERAAAPAPKATIAMAGGPTDSSGSSRPSRRRAVSRLEIGRRQRSDGARPEPAARRLVEERPLLRRQRPDPDVAEAHKAAVVQPADGVRGARSRDGPCRRCCRPNSPPQATASAQNVSSARLPNCPITDDFRGIPRLVVPVETGRYARWPMSRPPLPTLLFAIVCAAGAALLTKNLFRALEPLRQLGFVSRPLDELL